MRFLNQFLSKPSPQLTVSRQEINHNELYQIPNTVTKICVKSGRGWVTINGEDVILTECKPFTIEAHQGAVLISSLGKKPLVLETWQKRNERSIGRNVRLSLNFH